MSVGCPLKSSNNNPSEPLIVNKVEAIHPVYPFWQKGDKAYLRITVNSSFLHFELDSCLNCFLTPLSHLLSPIVRG